MKEFVENSGGFIFKDMEIRQFREDKFLSIYHLTL